MIEGMPSLPTGLVVHIELPNVSEAFSANVI
jgi:hypothetical protein